MIQHPCFCFIFSLLYRSAPVLSNGGASPYLHAAKAGAAGKPAGQGGRKTRRYLREMQLFFPHYCRLYLIEL
jgi:hypothetical protein